MPSAAISPRGILVISSPRNKKILWSFITVIMASIAAVSGVLARVMPLTLVEHEYWNSSRHSADESKFVFVGYPNPAADASAAGSIHRAILIANDEYEAGTTPVEVNGEQIVIPLSKVSFIEFHDQRRNRLLRNLNDEISTHPDEWDWESVEVELRHESNATSETSIYTLLTLGTSGSWRPWAGYRFEYVASRSGVEPRRIVQVYPDIRGRLLAFAIMMGSIPLAAICLLRFVYVLVRTSAKGKTTDMAM